MKSDKDTNLVWVDLEMTGSDNNIHKIVEVAVIITNKDLEILEESESFVIWQPQDVLDGMNDYVRDMHTSSGLLPKIRASKHSEKDVEKQILDLIERHVNEKMSPLCGNSVHWDRMFLQKYMPDFTDYLHYRNIDVSTIKELYKRWKPGSPVFEKKKKHEALEDIKESIDELKFYRNKFFMSSSLQL